MNGDVEYPAVEGTLAVCLEKVTAERDVLAEQLRATTEDFCAQQAELRRAESQVAALREALAATKSAMYCGEGVPGITEAALADTEAAAKAHDQRLRLEGARELWRRITEQCEKHKLLGTYWLAGAMDDMERGQ